MQQVAADTLGLPPDKVAVRLGDTRLPPSHGAIGSSTMANAGASVLLAAKAARDKAILLALTGPDAPFAGAAVEEVVVTDGKLVLARRNLHISYAELLARKGLSTLVADGDYDPIDAGRIINPKTARSQAIGGIIWGVGQALLEQSETDPMMGRFLNRNYSGYLVPTNADIPKLDVLFCGEFDEEGEPTRGKGHGRAHRRIGGARDCERRLSRDGQASARPADHRGEDLVRRPVARRRAVSVGAFNVSGVRP
jgi:xanthine dehydrogenase YagR molybdenum-binding subunit